MNPHKYFLLTHFENLDVDIIRTIAKLSVYKKFRLPFYGELHDIENYCIYDDIVYTSNDKYYAGCETGNYHVHITIKNNEIDSVKIVYQITMDFSEYIEYQITNFAEYVEYDIDFKKSNIASKYLTIEPIEMHYFGDYQIEYSDKLKEDGLYVIYAKKNQRIHFEYKID